MRHRDRFLAFVMGAVFASAIIFAASLNDAAPHILSFWLGVIALSAGILGVREWRDD